MSLKIRMRWTSGLVGAFACCCLVLTAGSRILADGGLKLTATSTLVNPCNGETLTGSVDVLLVVQTSQNKNGTHVVVHRTFHGTLEGDLGNVYKVSSVAQEHFDSLHPGSYKLPFENNVVGQGSAPNFTAAGTVKVFVDADQNPTGYSAVATSAECK